MDPESAEPMERGREGWTYARPAAWPRAGCLPNPPRCLEAQGGSESALGWKTTRRAAIVVARAARGFSCTRCVPTQLDGATEFFFFEKLYISVFIGNRDKILVETLEST